MNFAFQLIEIADSFNSIADQKPVHKCMKEHKKLVSSIITDMTDEQVGEFANVFVNMTEKDWMAYHLTFYRSAYMCLYNKLLLAEALEV